VMMRISREEEHYIGRARPGIRGRMKVGFAKDGRITALDMCSVSDNGPFERQGDCNNTGVVASLMYQPKAMRFRGISVLTNTPPRGPQSQPGGTQSHMLVEPVIAKAARQLGIDQVAIRRINAPVGKAPFGPPGGPKQVRQYVTSAFVQEMLDKGAAQFRWDERKTRSGQRNGTKVRGVGVALSTYAAGSVGFDGLIIIKPDGRLYIQSGIGNHGTGSVSDCHRISAELRDMPWDKVELTWGDTAKNLPWTCNSGGSQTTHAMSRAAHAAGMDAKKKLQEIAARDLGGRPEDYDVGPKTTTWPVSASFAGGAAGA
jgi:xanthine dehydrogenase molybdenum-binding subunit